MRRKLLTSGSSWLRSTFLRLVKGRVAALLSDWRVNRAMSDLDNLYFKTKLQTKTLALMNVRATLIRMTRGDLALAVDNWHRSLEAAKQQTRFDTLMQRSISSRLRTVVLRVMKGDLAVLIYNWRRNYNMDRCDMIKHKSIRSQLRSVMIRMMKGDVAVLINNWRQRQVAEDMTQMGSAAVDQVKGDMLMRLRDIATSRLRMVFMRLMKGDVAVIVPAVLLVPAPATNGISSLLCAPVAVDVPLRPTR